MTRADILKLVVAIAGLVGAVVLISPPTKPLPAPAGDWRKQLPIKTGTPPPAASTAVVPAAALERRPPPPRPQAEEAPPSFVVEQPAQSLAPGYRDDRSPPDDLVARRFRQGYHWAERNGVDEERDCYREPGDPFSDGCLAALTNRDRRFGYGPADDRYRHDRWRR